MKDINFNISPLHAETLATHLLIVLKNFLDGLNYQISAESIDPKAPPPLTVVASREGGSEKLEGAGSIPEKTMEILENLDRAYRKLNALSDRMDDETPQPISFSIAEAEAFIKAFTEEPFQAAALQDGFYKKHSYPAYFAQIYSCYLEEVSEGYVEALAA